MSARQEKSQNKFAAVVAWHATFSAHAPPKKILKNFARSKKRATTCLFENYDSREIFTREFAFAIFLLCAKVGLFLYMRGVFLTFAFLPVRGR